MCKYEEDILEILENYIHDIFKLFGGNAIHSLSHTMDHSSYIGKRYAIMLLTMMRLLHRDGFREKFPLTEDDEKALSYWQEKLDTSVQETYLNVEEETRKIDGIIENHFDTIKNYVSELTHIAS